MHRPDRAAGGTGNNRIAVLLIALLLPLLVTCAPTAPVVTTSLPPTEAPTEAPLPTSTIATLPIGLRHPGCRPPDKHRRSRHGFTVPHRCC